VSPVVLERRSAILGELKRQPLDVLVVGGGIVGAGIARDAALRGLRVGLVEQHDFAFGTSSRSSRLLHGGLRYLAQGRIGLVREASVEKRIIHSIAPHLAEPLAFVFPTYSAAPWAPWALWKLRIGVRLYDMLCGGENLGGSETLTAARVRERFPTIRPESLTGAVHYFDGLTNDARLVIDTLRSATNAAACLLNYCRFEHARREAPLWRCIVHDRVTDDRHELAARCLVNAAGPWAEQLEHSSVHLRLTKGVHLVIDRQRLSISDAVVMTKDDRILFAIPWGDRAILGTTDTDFRGEIDAVNTEPEDVRYILDIVNPAFPGARLTKADVISTWAGLRPLIADRNGRPSDISRRHEIREPKPGWWDVAGGKLTTYRLMAEQTVDRFELYLGRSPAPCATAGQPLLDPRDTEGVSAIVPPPVSDHAVSHYCEGEWAVHLDDVMVRRAGWHYYLHDPLRAAVEVADWMARSLQWTPHTREQELERYRAMAESEKASAVRR